MASVSDTHTSRPYSEYCTSYNESLKNIKDNILQEGRLSGRELQRCLLLNGVPMQDCPTPDQLLQRLGLSGLAQADTPTGTLERKNKKRFSTKIKVYKPKIFKSKGDKVDTQDTTEFLIVQLLHCCLQLISLEATNQTPVHEPLSPHSTSHSFSPGEEMEDSLKRLNQAQTDLLGWTEERDKAKGRAVYDNIQEVELLRKELAEVKRSKEEIEFRYSEMRDSYRPVETKEQIAQPPQTDTLSHSYRSSQEIEILNKDIQILRQENENMQHNIQNAEAYTSHIEAKYDELCIKLGNYQMQLSKTLNANHDMSVQIAKSSSLANLTQSNHPNLHLSDRSSQGHTHHSQVGGNSNSRYNTTPAQRKQDDVMAPELPSKRGSNQSLHKIAVSQAKPGNMMERSSSDRVFDFVHDSQQQRLMQHQKERHHEDGRGGYSEEKTGERASRSQRSDIPKSESSEGNLVSIHGMYKYESRGGSSHMVLGSEIDPSIFPLSMPPDLKKQLIHALNQCGSVQDLIQTIFTFGYAPSSESHDILRGDNQYLSSQVERLKAECQYLSHSLRESKDLADDLYLTVKKYECNNELLTRAIRYADQTIEVNCALLCLYDNEHSIISINQRLAGHEPLDYGLFISSQAIADLLVGSEQSLDLTLKQLYDTRHQIEQNIRQVISTYDSHSDIQRYLPIPISHSSSHGRIGHRMKRRSAGSSSPGNSSRDHTSKESSLTSGHGSMLSLSSQYNESQDNELTPDDIKRMRKYIEVFNGLKGKVCNQLVTISSALFVQRNKFEMRVKSPEVRQDTKKCEHWSDLETAIHLQELSAVKEEKAKLQSQAYLLEQEMRIIEHKLCAAKDHEVHSKQLIDQLDHELTEQARKRKKLHKELKYYKEQKQDMFMPGGPVHADPGMHERMLELKEAVEREKWMRQKYHELTNTFDMYITRTQDRNDQLLSFVRDLKKANVALVSAYEKAKRKNQHFHKKLLTYATQREIDSSEPNTTEAKLQASSNKFTQL
ncbi:Colorectal mutant cancer protein-like isoform X1 [Oopsacas minuta]|uniref:Colorectal mutant cancer protein-like isoform X1 n=1 Tax=Oopsacas minuta TaxID=111878 RepID=A0AAV7K725_9METZ|nr:Colorectal mutant cancer protein-like isoform X1 [Oopsacas minuta]